MTAVVPPDLEEWLVSYLRTTLIAAGVDVEVSNKEPAALSTPLEVPLIVIRDDSGVATSRVTFDRQLGVSVLAGTRQDDAMTRGLSRRVMAIMTDPDIALVKESPIASVILEDCRGPYAVHDDHDVARRYFTVGYSAIGTWNY